MHIYDSKIQDSRKIKTVETHTHTHRESLTIDRFSQITICKPAEAQKIKKPTTTATTLLEDETEPSTAQIIKRREIIFAIQACREWEAAEYFYS